MKKTLLKRRYNQWKEKAVLLQAKLDEAQNALRAMQRGGVDALVIKETGYFLSRTQPLKNSAGQVLRWFGTNTDISEKKQDGDILREREATINLFIENVPAAIAMFDRDMKCIRASRRWITDYALGDYKIIGLNHYEAFPETPERWREMHRRCLAGAIEKSDRDLFVRADGTRYWLKSEVRPWYSRPGRVGGIIIFCEDITSQVEAEQTLKDLIAARDEFLSIASHELKTPLTVLHLQLQLINRICNKERVRSHAASLSSAAIQSSQQMSTLLNELLDITRIRAGKFTLQKQELDLKTAIMDGVAGFAKEARQKGSSITVKADYSVVGRWDPARIKQMIANLLSNAIKYGEGNPIQVTLISDSFTHCAKLLVRDQGMGIPLEKQTKIFERFERAVSAANISGLGLGLYIARQIIIAHGGSIHLESVPGEGSLFVVELPIKMELQA